MVIKSVSIKKINYISSPSLRSAVESLLNRGPRHGGRYFSDTHLEHDPDSEYGSSDPILSDDDVRALRNRGR